MFLFPEHKKTQSGERGRKKALSHPSRRGESRAQPPRQEHQPAIPGVCRNLARTLQQRQPASQRGPLQAKKCRPSNISSNVENLQLPSWHWFSSWQLWTLLRPGRKRNLKKRWKSLTVENGSGVCACLPAGTVDWAPGRALALAPSANRPWRLRDVRSLATGRSSLELSASTSSRLGENVTSIPPWRPELAAWSELCTMLTVRKLSPSPSPVASSPSPSLKRSQRRRKRKARNRRRCWIKRRHRLWTRKRASANRIS